MSNSYYNSTFTAAIGTLARSSTLRSQFTLVEAGITAMEAALATKAAPTFTGTSTFAAVTYTGALTGGTGVVNIGSNQIYKDSSGRVGLGKTPNASALLDVAGQVWVDAQSGDATVRLLVSSVEKGKLAVTSAGRGYLESNGSEVLCWLNGDVGIGTTSPQANLHVVGDARLDLSTASSATAGGASALPATPEGYLIVNVSGTNYKLPYFLA